MVLSRDRSYRRVVRLSRQHRSGNDAAADSRRGEVFELGQCEVPNLLFEYPRLFQPCAHRQCRSSRDRSLFIVLGHLFSQAGLLGAGAGVEAGN